MIYHCPTCKQPWDGLSPDQCRDIRKAAGLTIYKLSERWGISPSSLSSIETGRHPLTFPMNIRYRDLAKSIGAL